MSDVYDINTDYKTWMTARVGERTLQNNLRASSIGFDCDRHHFYALTEYRDPPSPGLKAVFDEGQLHEGDVERKLRDMGYIVEGAQRSFRIEKPLISIRIDGTLRKENGPEQPYDAKSVNQFDYEKLNSAEDFILSKKFYQRNYVTQLLCYMYATNAMYGYLILKNKQNGQIKSVAFSFNEHMEYLSNAFKRAERVYGAREKKEAPERTEDLDLCLVCEFKHLCLPDLKMSPGVKLIEGDEIEKKLERMDQLRELKKEFEDLDEEVKGAFKSAGQGEYATSNWLIRVKEIKRKSYTVAEGSYLTAKFVRLEDG